MSWLQYSTHSSILLYSAKKIYSTLQGRVALSHNTKQSKKLHKTLIPAHHTRNVLLSIKPPPIVILVMSIYSIDKRQFSKHFICFLSSHFLTFKSIALRVSFLFESLLFGVPCCIPQTPSLLSGLNYHILAYRRVDTSLSFHYVSMIVFKETQIIEMV